MAVDHSVVAAIISQIAHAAEHQKRQAFIGIVPATHDIADGGDLPGDRFMAGPFQIHQIVMHRAMLWIVNEIVDHQHLRTPLYKWGALHIMRPDIAVEHDAGGVVMHQRTLGMLTLGMTGVGQTLGRQIAPENNIVAGPFAPLFHRIAGKAWPAGRHIFVHSPEKAVIFDQHIMRSCGGEGVGLPSASLGLSIDAGQNAQVLDFYIMAPHVDAPANDGNARCWCRLTGDGYKGLVDTERRALQIDRAAHFENDHALARLRDRGGQRAGAILG